MKPKGYRFPPDIVRQSVRGYLRYNLLGFKSFRTARIVLGGIELGHMLRKGQLASAADDAQMTAAGPSTSWPRESAKLVAEASPYSFLNNATVKMGLCSSGPAA